MGQTKMRVFALSDVHVDYASNAEWIANISTRDFTDDVLILAGDISDDPILLQRSFDLFAKRFLKVLYVPGNHDLWVVRCKHKNSFEKYQSILEIAKQSDISTEPFHAGHLSIVPLMGWYDYSFAAPSAELHDVWADYYACLWPSGMEQADITRFFSAQNASSLCTLNETIISFSHFVPRADLIPLYVPQSVKMLLPVMGSRVLEEQIRWLNPVIHVYGHSHLNRRASIDGIAYVNNAIGYPSEMHITRKELLCIFET
jgi:predicted phosphodiesterase